MPADVLILSREEDLADIEAIALIANQEGWKVRIAPINGATQQRDIVEILERSACAVVVWSWHARDCAVLEFAASRALALGKLTPVQLDHVVHSLPEVAKIDLSDWRDRSDPRTRSQLLKAIAKIAGAPAEPTQTDGVVARLWRRRWPATTWVLATIVVLLALGLIGVLQVISRPPPPTTAAPINSEQTARRTWAGLDHSNLEHLRAFVTVYSEAPEAREARHALAVLEQQAWLSVQQAQTSAAVLAAADRYQRAFPAGRFSEAATQVRAAETAMVSEAQKMLQALGYYAGAIDGAPTGATSVALARYASDHRLTSGGELTQAVMFDLRQDAQRVQPMTVP